MLRRPSTCTLLPYTTLFRSFTSEEWGKVLESMMLAGMAVSAAEPSGLWGTMKEALASRSAITASKQSASNELVKDRKSTRLNSSHLGISYAVFCLKKKKRAK